MQLSSPILSQFEEKKLSCFVPKYLGLPVLTKYIVNKFSLGLFSPSLFLQEGVELIRYLPSLLIQFLCKVFLDSTVQKPYVYILQLAVHTVQRNWISRLGRYLMVELQKRDAALAEVNSGNGPLIISLPSSSFNRSVQSQGLLNNHLCPQEGLYNSAEQKNSVVCLSDVCPRCN